ncbi:DUF4942 domain-containing protein [Cryobacterium algoricola]|uniref:DUF4942 domain-containing protein n=1 Tax=Cryobacterium algoricola TaxID=1259183 RepID=A0ABY2IDK8_9MICO|nr:DUF4942 domain-containing protein [Cryobacterium algoricola]TFB85828.1 DUF4942 domain-containing protein [Cryobacterium algoricola]
MFGNDFYPTPIELIDKMRRAVDMNRVRTILEPSAGRGDIVERIAAMDGVSSRNGEPTHAIDTIELDEELCMILTGKGYKPIARDFLKFNTYGSYDLIVMNPPFSDGDAHLIKAINMQRRGGQVACLLNAETLRNPYTNQRKELASLIKKYQGTVEYMGNAFGTADRTTKVETALVYINIEPMTAPSDILKNLAEAEVLERQEEQSATDLVDGDYTTGAVRRYEIEMKAGLKLIDEYQALKPLLSRSFSGDKHPILELTIGREAFTNIRDEFVKAMRIKYWSELFQSSEFTKIFTSTTRDAYHKQIKDLERYEVTTANIKQMQLEISQSMIGNLDESIVYLFDEFSSHYYDEQSNNIHYYNGWKTNKAYIINKKVITRLNAYSGWNGCNPSEWQVVQKLEDIEKVFAYLDGKISKDMDELRATLVSATNSQESRGIVTKYFTVDFYKKGTTHITFTRPDLLKKFNLIGSQRKGWLPPTYGKKAYTDLGEEDRDLVDEFEGKASYAETVANTEFYTDRPQLGTVRLGLIA